MGIEKGKQKYYSILVKSETMKGLRKLKRSFMDEGLSVSYSDLILYLLKKVNKK